LEDASPVSLGYHPSGGLGLVLVIVIAPVLMGRL